MCLFPIRASLQPDGGTPQFNPEGELKLPCGKCRECVSKRALEWATRARHEISEHSENSFITLTYNPENLPSQFIIKTDFQKFIKKLRKKLKSKIRYMVSYEYGSQKFRPHMHAIIFGYSPKNQKFLKQTSSGFPLFTSQDVEKLWDKGYHSIAEANEKTAYYIASYALKGRKKTIYNEITGEEHEVADTMDVSKRPAIGLNFLMKNAEQLVNSGEIIPRYYQKKMEVHFPELFEEYQNKVAAQIKNRSSGELYAKFTIDSQKASLGNCTFRDSEDSGPNQNQKRIEKFQKQILKQDRNNYVAAKKKEISI